MNSERLPPAEIEAIKQRVEEALEDAEAQWRALQAWLMDWRIRQSAKRAAPKLDAAE